MNDDDRDARIEAVAFAISDVADEREMFTQPLDPHDIQAIAGVAIAAYNAYLRERATDDDVVEAVVGMIWDYALTRDENEETARQALTAALDILLGKETHDATE